MTELPVGNPAGLRVLLVEDQMIVAMEIEDTLRGLGCVVVGPVGTLESAVRLAREEALDAAVLDVSLDGDYVFPVAEELKRREIPFIFATGCGDHILPDKWHGQVHLGKPFNREQLEKLLRNISSTSTEISRIESAVRPPSAGLLGR
jgi:CheY-like chemotaxis protein